MFRIVENGKVQKGKINKKITKEEVQKIHKQDGSGELYLNLLDKDHLIKEGVVLIEKSPVDKFYVIVYKIASKKIFFPMSEISASEKDSYRKYYEENVSKKIITISIPESYFMLKYNMENKSISAFFLFDNDKPLPMTNLFTLRGINDYKKTLFATSKLAPLVPNIAISEICLGNAFKYFDNHALSSLENIAKNIESIVFTVLNAPINADLDFSRFYKNIMSNLSIENRLLSYFDFMCLLSLAMQDYSAEEFWTFTPDKIRSVIMKTADKVKLGKETK